MSRVALPGEAPLHGPLDWTRLRERFRVLVRSHWGVIPILMTVAMANMIVSPLFESPMVDDWSYALMVRHLLEDHRYLQLGWSAVTLVIQILWGALFSLPFGFSFGALRLSTLALSLVGLLALYGLGKEFGLGEAKSSLLALTLLANPVYFGLAYTFMTDVPSTSLSTLSLWLYVRAIRKSSLRWWLLGSIACAVAFLSRQTGLLVTVGAGAWLLMHRSSLLATSKRVAAAVGIPFLAAMGFSLWLHFSGDTPEGYSYNLAQLANLPLGITARNLLLLVPVICLYLGIFALPYLAGMASDLRSYLSLKPMAWGLLGLAAAGTIAFLLFRWFGWPMPYLRYGPMVSPGGIGPNDLLGIRPTVIDVPAQWALTGLTITGAAGLLVVALRDWKVTWLFGNSPVGLLGFVAVAELLWVLFGYLYLWDWVLFDRYFLPALPPVLLLVAVSSKTVRLRWRLAVPVLVLFGLFSLLGTHDWIVFRQAAWSAAQTLVNQGVPLKAIDAGFEWDGWQLYEFSQSHPEEWHHADASPFWIGRRVAPVITSEYVISFSPLDGYSVIGTSPYDSWLGRRTERLYVLHKDEEAGP